MTKCPPTPGDQLLFTLELSSTPQEGPLVFEPWGGSAGCPCCWQPDLGVHASSPTHMTWVVALRTPHEVGTMCTRICRARTRRRMPSPSQRQLVEVLAGLRSRDTGQRTLTAKGEQREQRLSEQDGLAALLLR